MGRFAITLLVTVALLAQQSLGASQTAKAKIARSSLDPAAYPSWAHTHMIWIDSGRANQSVVLNFVKDFMAKGIPVGATDIDSQWATCDNNFVWNTQKYPDPQAMINSFHQSGVKMIVWATSMYNTDCPDYQTAKQKGYFLNDGAILSWWHGKGSLVDYSNPDALAWIHAKYDNVINMGVDGFKCDGTDPYVYLLGIAYGKRGFIDEREYAHMYYRDYYNYPRTKNPQSLIWARPVDTYATPYPMEFAPRDVMVSGWVGDQRGNFDGIKGALYNYIQSAWNKYANYGSDIGGYLTDSTFGPQGRTKEVLIRWTQIGAFSPLMENGGGGEHRPWAFDPPGTNDTLATYLFYVYAHLELGPYLLDAGTYALSTNSSVMFPLASFTYFHPSTYDYKLWHDILVCPVTESNITSRSVTFPTGDNWVDWFNPSKVYSGGSTTTYQLPSLRVFPVFKRQGSIIPMNVTTSHTGHGSEASAGAVTLVVSGINPAKPTGKTAVRGEYPDGETQEMWYEWDEASQALVFTATPHGRDLILLLRNVKMCPGKPIVVDTLRNTMLPQSTSAKMSALKAMGQGFYVSPEGDLVVRLRGDNDIGTQITTCITV